MTAPVTIENQSEKISMTAPVTMEQSGNKWIMHFVMPSKYTLETLPKPNNAAVKIRRVDGGKYAVIRFSCLSGVAKTKTMTDKLIAWMKSKKISAIGQPELARYNPPWTLPFWRRNEVLMKY